MAVYYISCDAPRNNPVDPLNNDNQLGQITGLVQTFSIPYIPLSDASVHWANGDALVYSDETGNFSINNTKRENGILVVEKEGYQTDSISVEWTGNKNIEIESSLNFIPVVDSISFFSSVLHKYSPTSIRPDYLLEAKLKISDLDNDIDSVFMVNPILNFVGVMDYNIVTKFYVREFTLSELGIESANEIIGKDFEIIVKDTRGEIFNLGSTNIKRVINEEVILQAPKGIDSVSVPFYLKWDKFLPGFDFNYIVQIYTDEIEPKLEFQQPIDAQEISFLIERSLSSGDYFWVLWCVDEFKNRSRSKPASFTIE